MERYQSEWKLLEYYFSEQIRKQIHAKMCLKSLHTLRTLLTKLMLQAILFYDQAIASSPKWQDCPRELPETANIIVLIMLFIAETIKLQIKVNLQRYSPFLFQI